MICVVFLFGNICGKILQARERFASAEEGVIDMDYGILVWVAGVGMRPPEDAVGSCREAPPSPQKPTCSLHDERPFTRSMCEKIGKDWYLFMLTNSACRIGLVHRGKSREGRLPYPLLK